MKVKIKIPSKYKQNIDNIKKAIAHKLLGIHTDTYEDTDRGIETDLYKAIGTGAKQQPEEHGELPLCEADALCEQEYYKALTDPIDDLKKKVFKLFGLTEFVDKDPDDPRYQDLYKAIDTQKNTANIREINAVDIDPAIEPDDIDKIIETLNYIKNIYQPPPFSIRLRPKSDTKPLGHWNPDTRTVELQEGIFKEDIRLTPELSVNAGQKVLLHEIMHMLNEQYKISKRPDWRQLSGWTKQKSPDTVKSRYNQNGIWKDGKWYHSKTATFVNNYASRNPKEDLVESLTYYLLKAQPVFEAQKATAKQKYIEKLIDEITRQSEEQIQKQQQKEKQK